MSKYCYEVHQIFNNMKRFSFPFNEKVIPQNGLYILFEKGEYAHGTDRIVRVGTHVGENQLRSRLNQHFSNENKDRSIFRKNIGRALLNKNKDDYINLWELDLTTRNNKEKYSSLIDFEYQSKIEREVTKYIQGIFSFVVFEESDKENRLFYEAKIISEISKCNECSASNAWLGNYSTKEKIKDNGLWQVNELYKEGFNDGEFNFFKDRLSNFSYNHKKN